jgi:hypothetical protein
MTDLCFEVLARSLFGENLPEARRLVAATAEALHAFHHLHSQWIGNAGGLAFAGVRAVATAMGRPDFVVDPSLLPTSYSRRFRYAVVALDEFVGALVARKRREPPGDDFFSLLLAAHDAHGAPLSNEQTPRRDRDHVPRRSRDCGQRAQLDPVSARPAPDGRADPGCPARPRGGSGSSSTRSPARACVSTRRRTGSAAPP